MKTKGLLSFLVLCSALGMTACTKATPEETKWTFEVAYQQAVENGYNGTYEAFLDIMLGKNKAVTITSVDTKYGFDLYGNAILKQTYHFSDGTTKEEITVLEEKAVDAYLEYREDITISIENGVPTIDGSHLIRVRYNNLDDEYIALSMDMLDLTDINLEKPGKYSVGGCYKGANFNVDIYVRGDERQVISVNLFDLANRSTRAWKFNTSNNKLKVDLTGLFWKIKYDNGDVETIPVSLDDIEQEVDGDGCVEMLNDYMYIYLSKKVGNATGQANLYVKKFTGSFNLGRPYYDSNVCSLELKEDDQNPNNIILNYTALEGKGIDFYISLNDSNGCVSTLIHITEDVLSYNPSTNSYSGNVGGILTSLGITDYPESYNSQTITIYVIAIPDSAIKYIDVTNGPYNAYGYFENGSRVYLGSASREASFNLANVSKPWYKYASYSNGLVGITNIYAGMDYYNVYQASGQFVTRYYNNGKYKYNFCIQNVEWNGDIYTVKLFNDHYLEIYSNGRPHDTIYTELVDPENNIYKVGNILWKKYDDHAEVLKGDIVRRVTMPMFGVTYDCVFYSNNLVDLIADGQTITCVYYESKDGKHIYVCEGVHKAYDFKVEGDTYTYLGEVDDYENK